MTHAEMQAEFASIRAAFEHDILPSLDAVKPLVGNSLPQVVRRAYERVRSLGEMALSSAGEAK